jgi:hypothetical protein
VTLPTLDKDPTCPDYSFILPDVALFILLGSDKITWKLSNFGVTEWSVITTKGPGKIPVHTIRVGVEHELPFAAGDVEQQSRQQQLVKSSQ